MTNTLHPQVAALLQRYRTELRDTRPSDSLDARIDHLVAAGSRGGPGRPATARRLRGWAAAAALALIAIISGIYIGIRLERTLPITAIAQQAVELPMDFSLWPADSVALKIPAEYSPQGRLVAVDPEAPRGGKRFWVDVVVSNDGIVRIDRIVPANEQRDPGVLHGITLQTP